MKCISIRQPWAWLVAHGFKPIENRPRLTHYRGPVLIHASSYVPFMDEIERVEKLWGKRLNPDNIEFGGIIGQVEIVDCVTVHRSKWFFGPFGYVLRHARPLPFFRCPGQLGFFEAPKNFN